MEIDLGRFGHALGFNLQRLGGESHPAQLLQYLNVNAGDGAVKTVGRELVEPGQPRLPGIAGLPAPVVHLWRVPQATNIRGLP
jgi:hypothetical protein